MCTVRYCNQKRIGGQIQHIQGLRLAGGINGPLFSAFLGGTARYGQRGIVATSLRFWYYEISSMPKYFCVVYIANTGFDIT